MQVKSFGYLIKIINDKIKVNAVADLKKHGLTLSQSRVLAFLKEKGGQATQKEIEDFLEVSHPTVVGTVTRMETNGFLMTWIDKQDRRNKNVRLTDKATEIGNCMTLLIQAQEEKMVSSFTEEEKEQLEKLLMKIYQNLD